MAHEVAASAEFEALRWWLLRWGPRADSGVVLAGDEPDGLVDVRTLAVALPVLALSGDFAPADMQYRMHREALLDSASGLWRASAPPTGSDQPGDLDSSAAAADAVATALRIGGDAVPEEMRGRWARQLDELRDACGRASG